jgi:hypothetical protein
MLILCFKVCNCMIIVQEIEKVSGSWNCWRIQMASRRWNRMSPKPKDFCSGCGMMWVPMWIRLFHGCFCAPHGFQARLRKSDESSERESNSTWRIRCNSLDEPPSGCWFFLFGSFSRDWHLSLLKSSLFMFVLASSSFVGRYSAALVSKSSSYEQCKCM